MTANLTISHFHLVVSSPRIISFLRCPHTRSEEKQNVIIQDFYSLYGKDFSSGYIVFHTKKLDLFYKRIIKYCSNM